MVTKEVMAFFAGLIAFNEKLSLKSSLKNDNRMIIDVEESFLCFSQKDSHFVLSFILFWSGRPMMRAGSSGMPLYLVTLKTPGRHSI